MTSLDLQPARAAQLAAHLRETRRTELALLDAIPDDRMRGERAHFLEPPIWEMGHVGWFQEKWLLRHLRGSAALHPAHDALYDSFRVSYRVRWDLDFPSRRRTRQYLDEVLSRVLDRLGDRAPTPDETYYYRLVGLHEDMHSENLAVIMQTLGIGGSGGWREPQRPLAIDAIWEPHDVAVPGGTFVLGPARAESFVFDNELRAHEVEVAPFRIAAAPVTNAQFAEFVADGGYRRRELWCGRGWYWRRRAEVARPLFWQGGGGDWHELSFGEPIPLDPWRPVVGICWYEADAYARWAGRRLPTEAEWEMAATLDPASGEKRRYPWGDEPPSPAVASLDLRAGHPVDVRAHAAGDSAVGCRQMLGNVWEWVADTFRPYPGFVAGSYDEYSWPYFGHKKVLRGGCWVTRSHLIRPTYRNFFKPHRRNLFAGFRTAP